MGTYLHLGGIVLHVVYIIISYKEQLLTSTEHPLYQACAFSHVLNTKEKGSLLAHFADNTET